MEILDSVDPERIHALRQSGESFWLDLIDPTAADLEQMRGLVTMHPLAFEDTVEFGQRAKLDNYPGSALLVAYGAVSGADARSRLGEVHLHISPGALVTVTREPLSALMDARRDVAAHPSAHPGHAVHGVLDALADSFLTALDGVEDAIDDLQESVVEHPTTAHRQRIFELRRQLIDMRRVLVPQRDLLAPGAELAGAIRDLHDEQGFRHALRDVHDHLDHAASLLAAHREQLAGLLDLYLTEVSTRLNEVMKRLTVIATVFLPLSFLVGFFGMNFAWLTAALTPLWTFAIFGVGLLLVSTVAVVWYLRRTD